MFSYLTSHLFLYCFHPSLNNKQDPTIPKNIQNYGCQLPRILFYFVKIYWRHPENRSWPFWTAHCRTISIIWRPDTPSLCLSLFRSFLCAEWQLVTQLRKFWTTDNRLLELHICIHARNFCLGKLATLSRIWHYISTYSHSPVIQQYTTEARVKFKHPKLYETK